MSRTRDPYWDSLKFSLMCMVVYIHTLVAYDRIPGTVTLGLFNFCYYFTMPLFTFVSGRFSQIGSKKKYFWGIIGLLETYFLFQVVQIYEKDCLIGNEAFRPSKLILMVEWTLWYLPALAVWRIATWCIPKHVLASRPKVVLATSFVISLLVCFIPVKKYSIFIHTFALMPYFYLGYYSNKADIRKKMELIPFGVALLIILSIVLLFCTNFNQILSYYFEYGFTYWACRGPSVLYNFGFRIFHFMTAMIIGLLWMRIIPGNNSIVSKWGQGTLFIYMFHPVILLLLKECNHRNWLPNNPWWSLLSAAIIVVGLGVLSRFKWMKIILSPITYWVRKRF